MCNKRKLEEAFQQNNNNFVAKSSQSDVLACSSAPTLVLFLDADRNGKLTSDDLSNWSWGGKGRGAILTVNLARDKLPLQPLEIRKEPNGYSGTAKLSGKLTVSAEHAERIRVFHEGKLVLGEKATELLLADVKDTVKLEIEASRFDLSDQDALVVLTFTPATDGKDAKAQTAVLRVAPWMMLHHHDALDLIFCAEIEKPKANKEFREKLAELTTVKVMTESFKSRTEGTEHASTQINCPPFVQDSMKIGYTYGPNQEGTFAVLRSPAKRWWTVYDQSTTHIGGMPVFTVVRELVEKNNAMDGGNLDVTPPTKEFPFGRIYYSKRSGSNSEAPGEFENFLAAQNVQAPFTLDASWLYVGHADEAVSFLPSQKGLVACIPSPRLAFELLLAAAGQEETTLLTGRMIMLENDKRKGEATVIKFLTEVCPQRKAYALNLGEEIKTEKLSEKLSWGGDAPAGGWMGNVLQVVRALTAALGEEVTFLELPVIFQQHKGAAASLTGNMVNMLSAGSTAVFQSPAGPLLAEDMSIKERQPPYKSGFFPAIPAMKFKKGTDLFESYAAQLLAMYGITARPLDGWDFYHLNHGEIHCATATRRQPKISMPWWGYEPRATGKSSSPEEQKSQKEKTWRVVKMPGNNDCFFHGVLYHTDKENWEDMETVRALRIQVSDELIQKLFGQNPVDAITKALQEGKDYIATTQSFQVSDNLAWSKNYKNAKRNDDFLGQNIADAVFRMRYTNEDMEQKKVPPGLKLGTIWGDSEFIAPAAADAVTKQIIFWRLNKEGEPEKAATAGDDWEDEGKIHLLHNQDDNHFDVIEGMPE